MRRTAERGFTLVEIMIVVAIIALLAAIAIPNVLRGRTTANESAAIGNLRALVSSVEMYRSVNNGYPDAWLADMYTTPNPDFGPPSFAIAMSGQTVQGYNYTYTQLPALCVEPNCTQYQLLAVPQTLGTTGTRAFLATESGQIRHCADAAATMTAANLAGENTIDVGPNLCNNSTAT